VVGTATTGFGVLGIASGTTGNPVGVYGQTTGGAGNAGYFSGSVWVTGSHTVQGTKSAVVPHPDGSFRRLYALEAPESLFEDFGRGTLASGQASVTLDPEFMATVRSDDYGVFLTTEGDTRGLYITNKTATGFTVRENQGGTSSVSFRYRVVAKRKDVEGPRLERIPASALVPPVPPQQVIQAPIPLLSSDGAGGGTQPPAQPTPSTPGAPTPTPSGASAPAPPSR
jgi:hypothetical protein